ncbi:DNA repair protein RadC [Komagataeibacter rhaeticus]|nr:DNA repair protein RadC [Komagataeibacter rhaeticus]
MRQRIRVAGAQSLADYELLEVLLFAAIPAVTPSRRPRRFWPILAVLKPCWKPPRQSARGGAWAARVAVMACPALVAGRLAHADLRGCVLFADMAALLAYCDRLPNRDPDGVRVFYLDSAGQLLADEVVPQAAAAEMCRAILARALELHAVSLITMRDTGAAVPRRRAAWRTSAGAHAVQSCPPDGDGRAGLPDPGRGRTVSLRPVLVA